MRKVAVLLNPEKDTAVALVRELVPWLQDHGLTVMAEHAAASALGNPGLAHDEAMLTTADFALVMGGDGTLLRASRIMSPAGVPMLAVRFGRFGFLTDIEPSDAQNALAGVLAGDYRIDERTMLRATVYRDGQQVGSALALNDVVITKGPLARLLRLATSVSGNYLSTYQADGLIIATPTGSTAYSLSAGGPLVTPDLQVTLITPICPHTLNARSLIISSKEVVEVIVESGPGDVMILTADGQVGIPLEPGDRITTEEAEIKARLISVDGVSFFDKLQRRLRWGGRFDM
jgi:NAD+ kinase